MRKCSASRSLQSGFGEGPLEYALLHDVSRTPGDFRPIIFDSTGTLHLSSQKWPKGVLGTAKWNTFAHEASDLFASYYGGILSSAARRWTAEAASIGEPRSA